MNDLVCNQIFRHSQEIKDNVLCVSPMPGSLSFCIDLHSLPFWHALFYIIKWCVFVITMDVCIPLDRACCKRDNEKCDPSLQVLFPLHLLELHALNVVEFFSVCLYIQTLMATSEIKNPLYFNSCASQQCFIQITENMSNLIENASISFNLSPIFPHMWYDFMS